MTLTLDPAALSAWPICQPPFVGTDDALDSSEDRRPWMYVFTSDELPTFCRLLLKMSVYNDTILRNTALYIEINPAIWIGQSTEMDSNPAGLSRVGRFLEPMRQLHSFGAAQVEGPLSGNCKGDIIQSVCKECPTAVDIHNTAILALHRGDEQVSKGHISSAILEYKKALNYVRSCCWQYDERNFVMLSGPFLGLKAVQAVANLKVRMQGRIAASYLKSGMLKMARIYTERAQDPRRPYDDRHNKMYSPLSVEPWEHVVYSEILHVAAQISYAHGDVWGALESFQEAEELNPLDEEQESMHEVWQKHADVLRTRRAAQQEAREKQYQKRIRENEGIYCSG